MNLPDFHERLGAVCRRPHTLPGGCPNALNLLIAAEDQFLGVIGGFVIIINFCGEIDVFAYPDSPFEIICLVRQNRRGFNYVAVNAAELLIAKICVCVLVHLAF